MKQSQQYLDALNILKGVAYSQLLLEDERMGLCQTGSINFSQIYSQIDLKGAGKVYPLDLIKFMSVHRIAISQRESEYIIYMSGSSTQFMDINHFLSYFSNGNTELTTQMLNRSQSYHSRGRHGDEMIKNFGQIEVSKLIEKEVQFYRTIEKLKDDYIKKYGFVFKNVITAIDFQKKGVIDLHSLAAFMRKFGVEISVQEFQAIGRRVFSKDPQFLTHKEIMKLFSPFQPLNFPTYRKQNNFQKAMDYINTEVAKLNINTQQLPMQLGADKSKSQTGFNKVIESYRNPGVNNEPLTSKYFYDQNYYNQLKQYRTNFFNPNRQVKKRLQTQMIGPQYHDHFFSDYYLYLEQRNRLEHYYNKFGKRYTFESPMEKAYSSKV